MHNFRGGRAVGSRRKWRARALNRDRALGRILILVLIWAHETLIIVLTAEDAFRIL